jgi:hypothetical protein
MVETDVEAGVVGRLGGVGDDFERVAAEEGTSIARLLCSVDTESAKARPLPPPVDPKSASAMVDMVVSCARLLRRIGEALVVAPRRIPRDAVAWMRCSLPLTQLSGWEAVVAATEQRFRGSKGLTLTCTICRRSSPAGSGSAH